MLKTDNTAWILIKKLWFGFITLISLADFAAQAGGKIPFGFIPLFQTSGASIVVVLTTGTSWTVPADWNSSSNTTSSAGRYRC